MQASRRARGGPGGGREGSGPPGPAEGEVGDSKVGDSGEARPHRGPSLPGNRGQGGP